MANNEKNFYVEALKDQYNLIFLIFFMLTSIVAWNPAPAVIGAGLEVLYLLFAPDTEIFKRYIRNKYADLQEQEEIAERQQRIQSLSHQQRRRFRKIDGIIESTKENLEQHSGGLGDRLDSKLDRLRERYLWMMEQMNNYEGYLNSLQRGSIEGDIDDVERQLENKDVSGRVKNSLEERLNILRKRLSRLERVRENHTIVQTQLETVEDILRLIYESSMTMQNPSGISQQVDELLFEVETTEETVLELDSIDNDEAQMEEFDQKLEKAVEKQQTA